MILFKPYGSAGQERAILRDVADVVCIPEGETGFDEALECCEVMLADVDIRVTDAMLARAKNLRAIVCRSIGVDFVDLQAAKRRGVMVFNSPEYCVNAVAEHAMGLLFALSRRIVQAHTALVSGDWEIREEMACCELMGKTLEIAGFGRIGHRIAAMARGIGMEVVAFDRYDGAFSNPEYAFVRRVSLETLLSTSDAISLHMPISAQTRGMIGREQFAAMKKGVLLLNVARGGIVDEAALTEALRAGIVGGAGLDVFDEEPLSAGRMAQWKALNVICTPHMAWNSAEAKVRNREVFLRQISALKAHEIPEGRVI